jgi:uncharacterized protein YkwD
VPHPPSARIALAVLVLVTAFAVTLVRPAPAQAGLNRSEAKLFRVINDVRRDYGVRRLRIGSEIQTSAHRWARYLRTHNSFYHGRMRAGTSEIVGWVTCRHGWARDLARMWLNSAGHRPYLLDGSARRVGVGVNTGRWSGYGCVRMAAVRFR